MKCSYERKDSSDKEKLISKEPCYNTACKDYGDTTNHRADNNCTWTAYTGRCANFIGKHKEGTIRIKDKTYTIKPFNLIDIYSKNPCKEEFMKLMEEWDVHFDITDQITTEESFLYLQTLSKNIQWLVDRNFLEEIIQETKLLPGMILINNFFDYKLEAIVTNDNKLFLGKGWSIKDTYLCGNPGEPYKPSTLEELNKCSTNTTKGFTWTIKQ